MESQRSQRDEHVARVFGSVLDPIHSLFGLLDLSEDESDELDRELSIWFYRFSRRTSHDMLSDRAMRCALLAGALRLVRDVAVTKHRSIPLLPGDVQEIAQRLGIDLEGGSETGRTES